MAVSRAIRIITAVLLVGTVYGARASGPATMPPDERSESEKGLEKKVCPGMELKKFYYDNGQVSSEGCWKNGQPEGEWRNYDPAGNLVSKGARVNLKLEGVWIFYKEGRPASEITYSQDRKNGLSRIFSENRIISSYYINDTLQGIRTVTDTQGNLLQTTPFKDGYEEGLERKYNAYGDAVVFIFYKNGMTVFRQNANTRDENGHKQGEWKDFHENGKLKWECPYKDDLKNGYYKEYDSLGNLLYMEKYVDGVKQEEAPELKQLTVHTEYYANGNPKFRVTYKDGKADGLCREYDSVTGKVVRGIWFKNGEITGNESLDEKGNRSDDYKEYYANGRLKCQGRMFKGKRYGPWVFYYENGQVEQEGEYRYGHYEGEWVWYYPDGKMRLKQEYYQGKADGHSVEYDSAGRVLAEGNYTEGLEEGYWIYHREKEVSEGNFLGGERDGVWRSYWKEGKQAKRKRMSFEGRYSGGLPDGFHRYFYEDGKVKEEGYYRMGNRTGVWMKFDRDGNVEMRIKYDPETGEEDRYNGRRTLPKEVQSQE